MGRRVATVLTAVAVTALAAFGGGAGGATATDVDATAALLDATNASRRDLAGSAGLARVAPLDQIASRHATAMAAEDRLFHNPALGDEVPAWAIVAENVGVGSDVARIHQAFLDSPLHRANVLDHRLTEVGIGAVVGSDGSVWVVVVFRTPAVAPAAVPATPAREVAPAEVDPRQHRTFRRPGTSAVIVTIEPLPATVPVDLTPQPAGAERRAIATPIVSLPAPILVSSTSSAAPRTEVLVATSLWLCVALGLLRRLRAARPRTGSRRRRAPTPKRPRTPHEWQRRSAVPPTAPRACRTASPRASATCSSPRPSTASSS